MSLARSSSGEIQLYRRLAEHVETFVVGRPVEVLQVHPQRLRDAQPRLEDQAEQEPIPSL